VTFTQAAACQCPCVAQVTSSSFITCALFDLSCCYLNEKKTLREMQTLRAGCSKAEPKMFAPPQTPFPVAQDGQNLISWRRPLSSPTNPIWWRLLHAILSYRGDRPTNKQRLPARPLQTHRQDRKQYTAPLSLVRRVTTEMWSVITVG